MTKKFRHDILRGGRKFFHGGNMEKKYIYFQPQYVGEFICDGSKCKDNCCERGWNIDADEATYQKYLQVNPQIAAQFEYNKDRGKYFLKKHPCPFLTDKKLCRLQLEYGEDFLSRTCRGYPRVTFDFGKFFERSLTLTCSLAAEKILFAEEPMKFELVEVSEKIHGGDKIIINPVYLDEKILEHMIEIQLAQISILQERTLTIDQRLIVLGFFLDKFQELVWSRTDNKTVLKLIATYKSEKFLFEEISPLINSFVFDANKFVNFIMKLIGPTISIWNSAEGKKFIDVFEKVLAIKPDKNNEIFLPAIAANLERLADARRDFSNKYSTFLENYLVNELFYSFYPWRFRDQSITKNFALFLITYKIFELMMFSAVQSGLDSKEDLLAMVDWFMTTTDHEPELYRRFLNLLEYMEDTYLLMENLL